MRHYPVFARPWTCDRCRLRHNRKPQVARHSAAETGSCIPPLSLSPALFKIAFLEIWHHHLHSQIELLKNNNNKTKQNPPTADYRGSTDQAWAANGALFDSLQPTVMVQLSFWRLKRLPANTYNGLCIGKCISKNPRQEDQKIFFYPPL